MFAKSMRSVSLLHLSVSGSACAFKFLSAGSEQPQDVEPQGYPGDGAAAPQVPPRAAGLALEVNEAAGDSGDGGEDDHEAAGDSRDGGEDIEAEKEKVMRDIESDIGYRSWLFSRGLFFAENERDDREIVMAAVRQHWTALQFASDRLRSDRQIVMAAVQKGWTALQFASEQLRNDIEIVMIAVEQSPFALHDDYVPASLKSDLENDVCVMAYRRWGEDVMAMRRVPRHLQDEVRQKAFIYQVSWGGEESDRKIYFTLVGGELIDEIELPDSKGADEEEIAEQIARVAQESPLIKTPCTLVFPDGHQQIVERMF